MTSQSLNVATNPSQPDVGLDVELTIDTTRYYVIRRYSGQLEGQLYVRGLMTLEELSYRSAADFYIIHTLDGHLFAGATGVDVIAHLESGVHGGKFAEACYQQYFHETMLPPTSITIQTGSTMTYWAKQ